MTSRNIDRSSIDYGPFYEPLLWALKHGVAAVPWSDTGYWSQEGRDGTQIMPPPELHVALDYAHTEVLRRLEAKK